MSESVSRMPQLTVLSMRQGLGGVAAQLVLTVGCCCVHCSSGPQVSRLCFAGCATATVVLLRPPMVGSAAGCRCSRCSRRCSCRGSSVMPWAPLSVLVAAECCGVYSVDAVLRIFGQGRLGVGLSRTLLAVGHVRWHAVPAGVDARRGRSVGCGNGWCESWWTLARGGPASGAASTRCRCTGVCYVHDGEVEVVIRTGPQGPASGTRGESCRSPDRRSGKSSKGKGVAV